MVDSKWNIIQQVSKTYQFKTTLNIRQIDAEFWLHSSFLFFQKSGLLSVALRKIIKALKSHVTCYNLSLNSFSTNFNKFNIVSKYNCIPVQGGLDQSRPFCFFVQYLFYIQVFLFLVPGCANFALVGNGFCNNETNNEDCNYDGGDCCTMNANIISCSECVCHLVETCAAGYHPLVGNGFCNDDTNIAECDHDGGDCCGPAVSCK